jgi:hypothetical protein
VLPTLLSLDGDLSALSPATVQFIILSGAVTAVAIWLLHAPTQEEGMKTRMADKMPAALAECTRSHCLALETLQNSAGRFVSQLAVAVLDCLRSVTSNMDLGLDLLTWSALQNIVHDRGTNGSAEAGTHIFPPLNVDGEMRRRDAVHSLCAPAARACRPGCFDLSIQF